MESFVAFVLFPFILGKEATTILIKNTATGKQPSIYRTVSSQKASSLLLVLW